MTQGNPSGPDDNGNGGDQPSADSLKITGAIDSLREKYEASQADRTQHDGKVLFWSRLAAFGVGIYTLITLGIAIVALCQLQTSRDTEMRQLRAYITANGGGATLSLNPKTKKPAMHAALRLRNSGSTPAYHLTVKIAAVIDKKDAIPFTELGPIYDEYGHSIIGPNTDYEIGTWAEYDPNDYPLLESGEKKTFIWGRIDYEDIFGGTHRWFE